MKKFFTKKRIIILISVILAVLLLSIGIAAAVSKAGRDSKEMSEYTEAEAVRGGISKVIEGSGVIEPNDRYEITALAKGEILYAPFEEGDFVSKDDVLYKIDDEDAQISIARAQNAIEKAQISQSSTLKDVKKLEIYAPASGMLGDLSLKETAQTAGGEVATITNTDELRVKVPFLSSEFDKAAVGDAVTLKSAMYMTELEGYVSHKFAANSSGSQDGSNVRSVEITIPNPGALGIGTTVSACVHTSGGDIYSAASGTIETGTVTSVIAEVGGTVKRLNFKEGDYVTAGQLIAVLENESLTEQRKSDELNMEDSRLNLRSNIESLKDYTITSPISGTVITKNSKAGDKIDNSNSQTVMMVVADMSCVKFVISVDELDIPSVKIGQTAVVDADAISGVTFDGVVSNIAGEGNSTGDGVTTFDVEITISEPGELMSGMNVNAKIVVASAENVVLIPEEALTGSDGRTAEVLVKSGESAAEEDGRQSRSKGDTPSRDIPKEDMPKGGMSQDEKPQDGKNSNPQNDRGSIPEGFEIRKVELGISDGTNVEIKSGINEGDIVAYIPVTAGGTDLFKMMAGGGPDRGPGGGPNGGPGGARNGGR